MSVIRGSMAQGSMISGIDGMQSFDYDETARNSTINSLMDKMMTDDLVIEQYYGRPLEDIDEEDRDSFETQMVVLDEESKSVFEQTFDEYDTFQDALEKPYGSFEMVEPRMTIKLTDYKTAEAVAGPIVLDCIDVRISLPAIKELKLNLDMCWKLLKDLVGKDLSKFSLPVFLNEPTTIL